MLSRFGAVARSGLRTMSSTMPMIAEGAAAPSITFKTRTRFEGVSSPPAKCVEHIFGENENKGRGHSKDCTALLPDALIYKLSLCDHVPLPRPVHAGWLCTCKHVLRLLQLEDQANPFDWKDVVSLKQSA